LTLRDKNTGTRKDENLKFSNVEKNGGEKDNSFISHMWRKMSRQERHQFQFSHIKKNGGESKTTISFSHVDENGRRGRREKNMVKKKDDNFNFHTWRQNG
jgi:hypothetical protein